MKLSNEFFKLPLQFDVERLMKEVSVLDKSIWFAHHENFNGNSAIPLISVNGGNNNLFKGAMAENEVLADCPYIKQVIASFGEVIGRSRLMGLAPGCEVPLHSDINYHWYNRVRIHIPIVTDPNVIFYCGNKQVHMKAGDCWIFDSWRFHRVYNGSCLFRIHLVVDICGSSKFWQMIKYQALKYDCIDMELEYSRFLPFEPEKTVSIITEKYNFAVVMSPGEVDGLVADLKLDIMACPSNIAQDAENFCDHLDDFRMDWRRLWSEKGTEKSAWMSYYRLRDNAVRNCSALTDVKLVTGHAAISVLTHLIAASCLNADIVTDAESINLPVTKSRPEQLALINRNNPCPCGSGSKYKQCHGKLSKK